MNVCKALGALLFVFFSALASATSASEKSLVYFDNDFFGPGETNIQALIPLVTREDLQIVGIGVVTGDGWLKEEAAHLLRFLEIAKHPEIPVFLGAEMPLLRTRTEMRSWEGLYGKLPWKGAWNDPMEGRTYHPDQPELIPPMPEGEPSIKASGEDAVAFLIRTVRANPGKVTIVTAGPLTNIALAIRIAPDLPILAKEIVCEGGKFDDELSQVTENTDYSTDFNFLFDPEAAHIVLTSPWRRITVVGDVTTNIRLTSQLRDRIGASGTPVAKYFSKYARLDMPFWDEITASVAVDRSLVTKDLIALMDVDTLPGPHYGRARIWNDAYAPHAGEQHVHIIQAIDARRFIENFVAATAK
jgi:inosine-uridine nucleoside N-ribohydrolase